MLAVVAGFGMSGPLLAHGHSHGFPRSIAGTNSLMWVCEAPPVVAGIVQAGHP